jgi:23S rRNA (cytidine1920-2'-O)/16S rRNA (cytidine1409-2'-O)-methyltransferase
VKKRLDVLLVERGLAESRAQAQALVLAGRVPGYAKPGTQVDEGAELEVEAPPRFVSRGGEKLAHALDRLGVDAAGRDCVDVGASTGGFTDVLLQRGAARVIALDVGYGQLHERLRSDPPVVVLAAPGWEAVVLVKPQFEAARGEAPKGVVRDVDVRRRVVRDVAEAALAWGAETVGVVDSGLPGPKGNREVFLHLVQREQAQLPDDIDQRIAAEIA